MADLEDDDGLLGEGDLGIDDDEDAMGPERKIMLVYRNSLRGQSAVGAWAGEEVSFAASSPPQYDTLVSRAASSTLKRPDTNPSDLRVKVCGQSPKPWIMMCWSLG